MLSICICIAFGPIIVCWILKYNVFEACFTKICPSSTEETNIEEPAIPEFVVNDKRSMSV